MAATEGGPTPALEQQPAPQPAAAGAAEPASAPAADAAPQADAAASPPGSPAASAATPPPGSPAASAAPLPPGSPAASASLPAEQHAARSSPASEAGLPPPGPLHKQSSNLANKIAAFASGVAPVRKGIHDLDEDAITVEEVLHKLETAARPGASGSDRTELPLPLVRSAHTHLVTARSEAARTAKELAELKASRVQHIPPSTWIKREQKYKMDQEKYEHTIGCLNQRIERLELELQVLREGSNVKPLEQRIQELEVQLSEAAEEKTKVQSKFHELSIKHRQLIETSPQVATIWNEVLVQQAADGQHSSAAMARLNNFDLRHTGANSTTSSALPPGSVSTSRLPGVGAAAAAFNSAGGAPPTVPPCAYSGSSVGSGLAEAASVEHSGPGTPMLLPPGAGAIGPVHAGAAAGAAGASGPGQPQQQPQQQQQQQPLPAAAASAEERAQALMEAVALEGLSPEARLAALQQLNYDLTMQLGCYQQMVARLKDAMEQSDLEKAELEADKVALELQLGGGGGASAHATGGGAPGHGGDAGGDHRTSLRGWAGVGSGLSFLRRSVGLSSAGRGHLEELEEASVADSASVAGLGSLSSSRHSSMELEPAAAAAGGGTPTKADAAGDGEAAEPAASSSDGSITPLAAATAGAAAATPARSGASGTSGGGLFAGRRARAAARAAVAAEALSKEVKELKRQLSSVQEENRFLVGTLVGIKMELAETQSSHDQAKRALVRALDKEAVLDLKVTELSHMLDMATRQVPGFGLADGALPAAAGAAAGAAAAAVAAAATAAKAAVAGAAAAAVAATQQQLGEGGEGEGAAAEAAAADGGGGGGGGEGGLPAPAVASFELQDDEGSSYADADEDEEEPTQEVDATTEFTDDAATDGSGSPQRHAAQRLQQQEQQQAETEGQPPPLQEGPGLQEQSEQAQQRQPQQQPAPSEGSDGEPVS